MTTADTLAFAREIIEKEVELIKGCKERGINKEDSYIKCKDLLKISEADKSKDGLIKELLAALDALRSSVCGENGFVEAVRRESDHAYPWPSLDTAEEIVNKVTALSNKLGYKP